MSSYQLLHLRAHSMVCGVLVLLVALFLLGEGFRGHREEAATLTPSTVVRNLLHQNSVQVPFNW